MQRINELAARWRDEADTLKKYGDERGAAVLGRLADEVLNATEEHGDEVLRLADAAALSGYGQAHLARLVREGKLPNAGRPGAPRIRRRDVPRKEGAPSRPAGVLPLFGNRRDRIARSIVTRT